MLAAALNRAAERATWRGIGFWIAVMALAIVGESREAAPLWPAVALCVVTGAVYLAIAAAKLVNAADWRPRRR